MRGKIVVDRESWEDVEFPEEVVFFLEQLLFEFLFAVHGFGNFVFFDEELLFFEFEWFLYFGSDLELVLDLFVGDFVDLGFVEVVSDELGGGELATNLNFLLHFGDLCVDSDEVLVVVAAA